MKQQLRRDHICEMIRRDGSCVIADLAKELNVSEMTIRRDLDALADQGLVVRTHGGAMMAQRISFEFEFLQRTNQNEAVKDAIAAAALQLIDDGASIMLDSGTTTLALARLLRDKSNITVITTSLPVAAELQYHDQANVLLLGGYLSTASPDVSGALAESNLEQLQADFAFLGCDAIDDTGAVYSVSPDIGRLLGKMAAHACRAYVVADGSKLGKTALSLYGKLSDMAGLITDDTAPRATLEKLGQEQINVIVVPAETRQRSFAAPKHRQD